MVVERVEIVRDRQPGGGYASVSRPGKLGNPYRVGVEASTAAEAVDRFRADFYGDQGEPWRSAARVLLDRPEIVHDGALWIACGCNGHLKGEPCHAEVIAEYLEGVLAGER